MDVNEHERWLPCFVDIDGTDVDHHCLNSVFNAVLHFMVTVGSSIKHKTRTL